MMGPKQFLSVLFLLLPNHSPTEAFSGSSPTTTYFVKCSEAFYVHIKNIRKLYKNIRLSYNVKKNYKNTIQFLKRLPLNC